MREAIQIFVEGGAKGRSRDGLRIGLDALLEVQKKRARVKKLRWSLMPCGPRTEAIKRFERALADGGARIAALLVDAEEPLADWTPHGRLNLLRQTSHLRHATVNPDQVHLMVQCMESWIVSDERAVAEYFRGVRLPSGSGTDEFDKAELLSALEKVGYMKGKHQAELLRRISHEAVAQRSRSFRAFRDWLGSAIDDAP